MKNLLVLTGGASAEREVSIKSCHSLAPAIDHRFFNIISVLILPDKTWVLEQNNETCHLIRKNQQCVLLHGAEEIGIDLVLPIVLGDAESGALIGFCESLGVQYIGSDVLASAVCFDKIFNKRIAQSYNINVVPFIEYDQTMDYFSAAQKLNSNTFIIKASQSGSSLGVSKVNNETSFRNAILEAQKYDQNILIERFINAREIFCSVYQDEHGAVHASLISEVFYEGEIFTYEKKNNPALKRFEIPANLDSKISDFIAQQSMAVFRLFRCKGYARIDHFIDTATSEIYYSEINTIPGSSDASSFVKMLAASGVSKEALMSAVLGKYV